MANIETHIPALKLNDGNSIPMLAYGTGTAWFKRGDENTTDRSLIDGLKAALKLGYYHLDGAEGYKNEAEIGIAIKESGIPREKLFVTTKVQRNIADIDAAIATSLKKLQTEYVDLYLIHSPYWAQNENGSFDEAKLQNAWSKLEALKEKGLAKSIGVSNFLPEHLSMILKTAKVVPAVNQLEFHPYLQRTSVIAANKQHGIATEAYGPLTAVSKASPGPLDEYLAGLATKYAVSTAEVCLRWCIDQDVVAVTTSTKELRLSDYLRATRFKLTPKEVEEIGKVGGEKHFRGFFTGNFKEDDRT